MLMMRMMTVTMLLMIILMNDNVTLTCFAKNATTGAKQKAFQGHLKCFEKRKMLQTVEPGKSLSSLLLVSGELVERWKRVLVISSLLLLQRL